MLFYVLMPPQPINEWLLARIYYNEFEQCFQFLAMAGQRLKIFPLSKKKKEENNM